MSTVVLILVQFVVIHLLHPETKTLPSLAVVLTGSAVGFMVAVVNGFLWNRHWTFRQGHVPGASGQFAIFLLVNIVGLGLNTALMALFYERLQIFHALPKPYVFCQLLATVFVTFWNFFANSRWTFAERD